LEQGPPAALRPVVVHREAVQRAAGARSVRRPQEASLKALWPEGSLPEAWPLAALLSRAVLRWGLRPASPTGACQRRRAAHPSVAYRSEQALQLAQARWLPPEVETGAAAVSDAAAEPQKAGAGVSGAAAAPQQAEAAGVESDVVVQPPEVAAAVLDAAAVLQQGAGLDVAAVPQQAAAEVWGAAAELQRAAGSDVAEPRRAAPVA